MKNWGEILKNKIKLMNLLVLSYDYPSVHYKNTKYIFVTLVDDDITTLSLLCIPIKNL